MWQVQLTTITYERYNGGQRKKWLYIVQCNGLIQRCVLYFSAFSREFYFRNKSALPNNIIDYFPKVCAYDILQP